MQAQRHIINRQVLEIQFPESWNVNETQKKVMKLFRERLIPILEQYCDQLSADGRDHQIEQLTLDLGELEIDDLEKSFPENFRKAITRSEIASLAHPSPLHSEPEAPRSPLDLLTWFLKSGSMPWWAPSTGKHFLRTELDQILTDADEKVRKWLYQLGQQKAMVSRFVSTFSEAQLEKVFTTLAGGTDLAGKEVRTEFLQVLSKINGGGAELRHRAAHEFDCARFEFLVQSARPSDWKEFAIRQTLLNLELEIMEFQRESKLSDRLQNTVDRSEAQSHDVRELHRLVKKAKVEFAKNPLIVSFCAQLRRALNHPLFSSLPRTEIQAIKRLVTDFIANQPHFSAENEQVIRAVTESQLGPLAIRLQSLESRLENLARTNSGVMEPLRVSGFSATDSLSLENAGLVILWPFLSTFFRKLNLLEDREFVSEEARHKAAWMLQYAVEGEEEEIFEGKMVLNKILCGIDPTEPLLPVSLSEEDKAHAEGLLRAVISRGPMWQNLSLTGMRNSYLKRDGLLKSRDGHWLLQVEKATHDITLSKLPWGFTTVKLPWMNQILVVEWN